MKLIGLNTNGILCFLVIGYTTHFPLTAQNSKLDSLKNVMDQSVDDTLKIDAMLKYGNELKKTNLERSLEVLGIALEKAH